jgi:hypothetical protein
LNAVNPLNARYTSVSAHEDDRQTSLQDRPLGQPSPKRVADEPTVPWLGAGRCCP